MSATTRTAGRLLPDGTRCYSGASCRRHGNIPTATDAQVRTAKLKAAVESLLDAVPDVAQPAINSGVPEWWSERYEQKYQARDELLRSFGMTTTTRRIVDNPDLARNGFLEVETGEPGTRLYVGIHNTDGRDEDGQKFFVRTWLLKDDKPVGMLWFSTYRQGQMWAFKNIPAQSQMGDIEVRSGHRGKQYGLEMIRKMESLVLGGRPIYSGGSYTPEGRRSLGGKLPYGEYAMYEHRKTLEAGGIPDSSYRSTTFVHDWDTYHPKHTEWGTAS